MFAKTSHCAMSVSPSIFCDEHRAQARHTRSVSVLAGLPAGGVPVVEHRLCTSHQGEEALPGPPAGARRRAWRREEAEAVLAAVHL